MIELFAPYSVVLVKILILLGLISLAIAYLTYMERKVIGHMQRRYGPMRVGWHGLLQPIADGLKFIIKEDIIPEKADRFTFILAPVLSFIPAFIVFALIPFGSEKAFWGYGGYVADVDHEGKGIVSEAVIGVLGVLFEVLGAHRVISDCNENNLRSIRLLERCGFRREGHLLENRRNADGSFHGDFLYGMLRREYEQLYPRG